MGRRPCPLVRLCVLHVLKLLRGSAFALGIGGASHILVSLSKQVMGNGIVRIHAESMLERARRQLSFPFFLKHLPQQDVGPGRGGVQPDRALQKAPEGLR